MSADGPTPTEVIKGSFLSPFDAQELPSDALPSDALQVTPVILEGPDRRTTLTAPGEKVRFQLWMNLEGGRLAKFHVYLTYKGVRHDGTPIVQVTPRVTLEPDPLENLPENDVSDPSGYDGPVVVR